MRFAEPALLHLLWTLPVLAVLFVIAELRRRRVLALLADAPLARRLAPGTSLERRAIRTALWILAAGTLALALARPQWGMHTTPVQREGVDIFLALDTSHSMLAEDVRPNRLTRARLALSSFLDRVQGDRVGLIVFGGTAQVVCPLTLDLAAVQAILEVADPGAMSDPGTRIAEAIAAAREKFSHRERADKVLILLTDGEDQGSDPVEEARRAKEEGILIYTIGIGTPRGEAIPLRDERGTIVEYKKDREGKVVTSRLDEPTLAEIARITGGEYYRSSAGEAEIDAIYRRIARLEKTKFEERLKTTYEERFYVPLGAAVLLLLAASLVREGSSAGRSAPQEETAS